MSRYDPKTHDEVASKKSDDAQRRTKPAVYKGPPSPAALARLYNKGKETPSMGDRSDRSYNQSRAENDRQWLWL
jgi:hypothetical protein